MWKLGSACSRYIFSQTFKKTPVRSFLSDSFKLEQVWDERLASPIIKKINVSDMFYELDHQFQHYANASALDIDLFVNAVNDDLNFDEIEDVVHKLRLSPEALNILPSTSHALIRHYLKFNKTDNLLRVLDDRLNYGIFLDDYCTLLLLDTFIKNNNFRDAAKVSVIHMLQEHATNPLINVTALFSCHKYLENPVSWSETVEVEEDDGEEVKVRLKYIRNPYFDDHFDIIDPIHLIGKTFYLIGSHMNDPIGRTHQLLGLILHEKYDKAKLYVQKLLSTNHNNEILKDGLAQTVKILDDRSKNKSEGVNENIELQINELKTLLKSFSENNLLEEKSVLQILEQNIQSLVKLNEKSEIDKQVEHYKEWEENRAKLLADQMLKLHREKQLAEVERQKQILQEKEEELYFFDNEDKLDLIIEEKNKIKEKQREHDRLKQEAKLNSVRPPKREEKKKSRVPPEPDLKDFIDENIPMKIVNTKL